MKLIDFKISILLVLILLVAMPTELLASGDNDTNDTSDTTDSTELEIVGDCATDSDCKSDQSCMSTLCITTSCNADEDCIHKSFACRQDGLCVIKACTSDNDCPQLEICLDTKCLTDPTLYAEGGLGGCQLSEVACNFDIIMLLAICLLLLVWIKFREQKN